LNHLGAQGYPPPVLPVSIGVLTLHVAAVAQSTVEVTVEAGERFTRPGESYVMIEGCAQRPYDGVGGGGGARGGPYEGADGGGGGTAGKSLSTGVEGPPFSEGAYKRYGPGDAIQVPPIRIDVLYVCMCMCMCVYSYTYVHAYLCL